MRPIYLALGCVVGLFMLSGAGCPGDGGGTICGGLLGGDCPEGQFCDFTDGSCGAADQTGVCRTRPETCTLIFAPVCGCDGQTYGNECEAAAAGVSVAEEGECNTNGTGAACGGITGSLCASNEFCHFEDGVCGEGDQTGVCEVFPDACPEIFAPVCGCDGQTYGNECEANGQGVSVARQGECQGEVCGGLLGTPCPEGRFCNFESGTCGAADQTGICTVPPEACTDEFIPVCGCDGITYGNSCEAAAAQVSVASEGECP